MSKRAIIIVNPVAGKMNIQEDLPNMIVTLKAQDYDTKVYTTKARGDAARVAEKFGRTRDLVVCCGGDGTLNEVISGLLKIEEKPLLLYYPCGSTNDFAKSINIPFRWKKAVRNIVNGKEIFIDVCKFNDKFAWRC